MPLFNPGILATGGNITGDLAVTGNGVVDGTFTSVGTLTASTGAAVTGDVTATSGNLILSTAGKGIQVKEGSNAKMGTAVLNGITEVTVSTTAVASTSRVFLSVESPGGTVGGLAYVSSRVGGTSFGIKSLTIGDTSTVAWLIIDPA